jgi:hypothetical protein
MAAAEFQKHRNLSKFVTNLKVGGGGLMTFLTIETVVNQSF